MPLVLDTTTDPERRLVVLDDLAWAHIVRFHPMMAPHLEAVMAVVRSPDHRERDPRPGRERYFGRGLGPRAWLRVVVDFVEEPGYVVTAFPQDRAPAQWSSQGT
jgi:hypothetical protein